MTSDLVARLRERVRYGDARLLDPKGHDPLSMQAADRIEALEAALRRRTDLMVNALPVLRGAGSETLADNMAFAIWHDPDLPQPPVEAK